MIVRASAGIQRCREVRRQEQAAAIAGEKDLAVASGTESVGSESGLIEDEIAPSACIGKAPVEAIPFRCSVRRWTRQLPVLP